MRSPPMSIGGCAASTTQTCLHSTDTPDSQLTDLYVVDGAVRGVFVRDVVRGGIG